MENLLDIALDSDSKLLDDLISAEATTIYWNTVMTPYWDTPMTALWDTTMDTVAP